MEAGIVCRLSVPLTDARVWTGIEAEPGQFDTASVLAKN